MSLFQPQVPDEYTLTVPAGIPALLLEGLEAVAITRQGEATDLRRRQATAEHKANTSPIETSAADHRARAQYLAAEADKVQAQATTAADAYRSIQQQVRSINDLLRKRGTMDRVETAAQPRAEKADA